MKIPHFSRRGLLKGTAAAGLVLGVPGVAETRAAITRPVPTTGERLPVIGMGTSRTFDVGESEAERAPLREVLRTFFDEGGALIDSSPMYGRAERVTGDLVRDLSAAGTLFAATKVWTNGRDSGVEQMNRSFALMGVETMDLMQVHNLRDTAVHLRTIREWKDEGRISYVGITTSRESQFDAFAEVMRTEPLDFVQLNYSLGEREAERVLLPLAQEKGIAVLVNRPYMRGRLFSEVRGKPLPAWAKEIDCDSWAQIFLKFILSHPATTCVIPATSKPKNMRDNMAAGFGALPDEALRKRIMTTFA